MKLDQEISGYLEGKKFSNSLMVKLERSRYEGLTRENAIINIIKGNRVIHIGCTDHIPLIREKIANNKWLHKLITDNCNECIGIDIDRESIEYVKNEIGYKNVMYGDILNDDLSVITNEKWDYAVLGEIIEHIDDPVHFLKTFKDRFGESVSKFIITVPNIYNRNHLRNMFKYKEIINSDHRYWFTPYTISKILVQAGYNPEQIIFSNLVRLNYPRLAIRKIKRLLGIRVTYPFYSFNTMIITGTISY